MSLSRRGIQRLVLGVVLVGAVALVGVTVAHALGWGSHDDPPPVTLHGVLKLSGGGFSADGAQCLPTAGYDDIVPGAAVVVHDAGGKVIATGALQGGRSAEFFDDGGRQIPAACEFPFEIAKVPSSPFYGVEVSHRGTVTFSDVQVASGSVTLSLGS